MFEINTICNLISCLYYICKLTQNTNAIRYGCGREKTSWELFLLSPLKRWCVNKKPLLILYLRWDSPLEFSSCIKLDSGKHKELLIYKSILDIWLVRWKHVLKWIRYQCNLDSFFVCFNVNLYIKLLLPVYIYLVSLSLYITCLSPFCPSSNEWNPQVCEGTAVVDEIRYHVDSDNTVNRQR